MSDDKSPQLGRMVWHDLTVPDAVEVRKFYEQVVGWTSSPVSMGDYEDFCMNEPSTGETVGGVCHARGSNADIPPQWLIYITVADVKAAAAKCTELGGSVVTGPRTVGGKLWCIIRDPAGAVSALIEP